MKKVNLLVLLGAVAYFLYMVSVTSHVNHKPEHQDIPLTEGTETAVPKSLPPAASPESAEQEPSENAEAEEVDEAYWWEECSYTEPMSDISRQLDIEPEQLDDWQAGKQQCSKLCNTFKCSLGVWYTEGGECACILKEEFQAGEDDDGIPTDLYYFVSLSNMKPNKPKGDKREDTSNK